MTHDDDAFVREGLLTYHRKALATIDRFLTMLGDELKTVLQDRRDWGRFEPAGVPSVNMRSKKWVDVQLNGKLDGEAANFAIFIQWGANAGPDPIFAVHIYQVKLGRFLPLTQPQAPTDIISDGSDLYLKPRPDFDISHDFGRLIDAALNAVARDAEQPPV